MIPLELKDKRWYAWQMLPGYLAHERIMEPYYSPIYVTKIHRLKTGKNLLHIEFANVCYAQGVQGFDLTLKIVARRYHFIMATIEDTEDRGAIISEVSFPWVEKFCPHLLQWRPVRDVFRDGEQQDVSVWLTRIFS